MFKLCVRNCVRSIALEIEDKQANNFFFTENLDLLMFKYINNNFEIGKIQKSVYLGLVWHREIQV